MIIYFASHLERNGMNRFRNTHTIKFCFVSPTVLTKMSRKGF